MQRYRYGHFRTAGCRREAVLVPEFSLPRPCAGAFFWLAAQSLIRGARRGQVVHRGVFRFSGAGGSLNSPRRRQFHHFTRVVGGSSFLLTGC
jgi:hypothetical protein